MSSPALNPIWRWLIFAGMLLAAGSFSFSAARYALAAHWAASPDPEAWLRAAATEPANADLWYQLGHYRQLDFEHSHLPLAISSYQHATSINPGSAFFCMALSRAYETSSDISRADPAFR